MHGKWRDVAVRSFPRECVHGAVQCPCAAAAAGEVVVILIVPAFQIAFLEVENADLFTSRLLLERGRKVTHELGVVAIVDVIVVNLRHGGNAADQCK